MTEMEKVIKGLECCNDTSIASLKCEECPYREVDTCSAIARLHVDALILLREQEPVEPFARYDALRREFDCGVCDFLVGFENAFDDRRYRAKYCPECGRKVKWDETD